MPSSPGSDTDARPLFHIVAPADWAAAQQGGPYRAQSLATEGFVHCSFAEQVRATLSRHYPGVRGLVLLELDPGRIDAPVRVEHSAASGDAFPHVYGPIPLDAVVAEHRADDWADDGVNAPEDPGGAASPDR